jgi:hypothetical protein
MTVAITFAEAVLARAGFTCWQSQLGPMPTLGFEDASLMGFVFEFPTAQAIVDGWREAEQKMINQHAHAFRRAGDKAWNVYSVFLTTNEATKAECRQLRLIEEDLEQTRKLTGAGQASEVATAEALLPILPISTKPQLGTFDADARLARRLDALVPGISNLLLDDAVEAVQVLQHLSQPR